MCPPRPRKLKTPAIHLKIRTNDRPMSITLIDSVWPRYFKTELTFFRNVKIIILKEYLWYLSPLELIEKTKCQQNVTSKHESTIGRDDNWRISILWTDGCTCILDLLFRDNYVCVGSLYHGPNAHIKRETYKTRPFSSIQQRCEVDDTKQKYKLTLSTSRSVPVHSLLPPLPL